MIHHPSKIRNIVDYTGKRFPDKYVEENDLSEDFCYTINDVAKILDLVVGTVQTYIIPRLDVAYAGPYIRGYMGNNRLKRVVSKSSLIDFLGWYIQEVEYSVDTYAISRVNPDLDIDDENISQEHKLIHQIQGVLENAKRTQPFLNFAANYLEQRHFSDHYISQQYKDIRHKEAVQETILNNVLSFNQLKEKLEFKHNEQVKRWLKKNAHTKLVISSLDTTGPQNKDNARYIIKPNINVIDGNIVNAVSLEYGKPYFLNIYDKTKAALSGIETEEPIYVSVLFTIISIIDEILPLFETWEAKQKEKRKKKEK